MSAPLDPADVPVGLTPFQARVVIAFYESPESRDFLLAGGAALVAQGLSDRSTDDLDLFTRPTGGSVAAALAGLRRQVERRDWDLEVMFESETFCRAKVADGPESVLVDLAVDSAPDRPPIVSVLGPSFAPEDLAGRKTVALFGRAAPRDFVDVFVLAARFGRGRLLELASEVDAGFDLAIFAEMLDMLRWIEDAELPIPPTGLPGSGSSSPSGHRNSAPAERVQSWTTSDAS